MFSMESSYPVPPDWRAEARRGLTAYAASLGASEREQADVAIGTDQALASLTRVSTAAFEGQPPRRLSITAEPITAPAGLEVVVTDSHVRPGEPLGLDRVARTTAFYGVEDMDADGLALAMRFAVGSRR